MSAVNPIYTSGGGATLPTYTFGAFGFTQSLTGVTVTTGAAETKGSYATIATSTTAAVDGLILDVFSSNSRCLLLDLRINGTTTIWSNLIIAHNTANSISRHRVPCRIPSGSLVEIRAASTSATTVVTISTTAWQTNVAETATTVTAIGPTTVAANQGAVLDLGAPAWVQIGSALASDIKGLFAAYSYNSDLTTRALGRNLLEIGTGPDILNVTSVFKHYVASATTTMADAPIGPLMQAFPTGTIFWGKASPVSGTPTDTVNLQLCAIA